MREGQVEKQPPINDRNGDSLADVDASTQKRQREAGELGKKVVKEIDDLLDEIDDVLETNAEDFVNAYVQQGGE